MDNCNNSRANTCHDALTSLVATVACWGMGALIRSEANQHMRLRSFWGRGRVGCSTSGDSG